MHFDLIIIGAGPIGLVCGLEARQADLRFLILEKGLLVNALFNFPLNMTFFSTSLLLEIGDVPFISHTDKPTRSEALEYYRRVAHARQLPIHLYEEVHTLIKKNGKFEIATQRQSYSADHVILATGFYGKEVSLNIPGENLSKVKHYYDDPHPYFQQQLAVIGGGNSACDAALECWQKGAKVTMIVRDSGLKDTIKYWIKPNIENRIKEGSILAYFNATVIKINPQYITIQQENKVIELPNDFVLAMTGYQPDYGFLEEAGIAFQTDEFQTPIYDEVTLESSVPGLYLAGVLLGGRKTNKWFIENTRDHGQKIINHIQSNKKTKNS